MNVYNSQKLVECLSGRSTFSRASHRVPQSPTPPVPSFLVHEMELNPCEALSTDVSCKNGSKFSTKERAWLGDLSFGVGVGLLNVVGDSTCGSGMAMSDTLLSRPLGRLLPFLVTGAVEPSCPGSGAV